MLGLITKRIGWTLTWRGRLALLALLVLPVTSLWFAAITVYPFLAVTDRVSAQVLVIEGWMQAGIMKQAAEEFHSGSYQRAILIRPVLSLDDPYESGRYYGSWLADSLVRYGVPEAQLTTLFPNVVERDRTYHSALAVKQWLVVHGLSMQAINLVTQGPHARRSRLVYQKVFGDCCEVGIISLKNLAYDSENWWRTSEGVRDVIGESLAYVYSLLFKQLI